MKRSATVILCRKAVRYTGNLCKRLRVNQEKEPAEQQQKRRREGKAPVNQQKFIDGSFSEGQDASMYATFRA